MRAREPKNRKSAVATPDGTRDAETMSPAESLRARLAVRRARGEKVNAKELGLAQRAARIAEHFHSLSGAIASGTAKPEHRDLVNDVWARMHSRGYVSSMLAFKLLEVAQATADEPNIETRVASMRSRLDFARYPEADDVDGLRELARAFGRPVGTHARGRNWDRIAEIIQRMTGHRFVGESLYVLFKRRVRPKS